MKNPEDRKSFKNNVNASRLKQLINSRNKNQFETVRSNKINSQNNSIRIKANNLAFSDSNVKKCNEKVELDSFLK